jgi:hypothetical protein
MVSLLSSKEEEDASSVAISVGVVEVEDSEAIQDTTRGPRGVEDMAALLTDVVSRDPGRTGKARRISSSPSRRARLMTIRLNTPSLSRPRRRWLSQQQRNQLLPQPQRRRRLPQQLRNLRLLRRPLPRMFVESK